MLKETNTKIVAVKVEARLGLCREMFGSKL